MPGERGLATERNCYSPEVSQLAPEKVPSQKESSLPTIMFQGLMLNFGSILPANIAALRFLCSRNQVKKIEVLEFKVFANACSFLELS